MNASPPKALVLRTAGTNCDRETVRALEEAGAETQRLHLNALAREPQLLSRAQIFVLAGGFSYGDSIAAGRVLGVLLRQRLFDALRGFIADGGHVLGICNGFQVLVELGLFQPDRPASERTLSLTDNVSARFECRWVTLRAEDSALGWLTPGSLLPVPVAHAEGRLVVRDEETLAELRSKRQIALSYVAPDGGRAEYPDDPNGSVAGIAGLCDPTGRILGLMPHPERNITPWQHPRWTRMDAAAAGGGGRAMREEGEGLAFFRGLVQAAGGVPI